MSVYSAVCEYEIRKPVPAISLDLSLYTINALSKSTPIPDLYRFNSSLLSPMKMGGGGGGLVVCPGAI
jgi:hypothetical protein